MMELWIRSQEGTLGKVLFIRPAGLALDIHFAGDYVTFEHFKTEERALEVLDEIQKYILLPNADNSAYVYEMPSE